MSTSALGWGGTTLAPVTLFGCTFRPVVRIDPVVHHDRVSTGFGPQLDEDVLAVWEWPESGARPSPVTLLGALFDVAGPWRRSLDQARRWNAFSPTALVDPTGDAVADTWCRWECGIAGTGLVDTSGTAAAAVVTGRRRSGHGERLTGDRWVEEFLYSVVVRAGLLPAGTVDPVSVLEPAPESGASSGAPSARPRG